MEPVSPYTASGWLDRFSERICQASGVNQEEFDKGIRAVAHVGRKISVPTNPRNNAASGQLAANASLIRRVVSLIRTAIFSNCSRMVENSPRRQAPPGQISRRIRGASSGAGPPVGHHSQPVLPVRPPLDNSAVTRSQRDTRSSRVCPQHVDPLLKFPGPLQNDLKSHPTGRNLITSLMQLRQMIVSHMRQLKKRPPWCAPSSSRLTPRATHALDCNYYDKVVMRRPLGVGAKLNLSPKFAITVTYYNSTTLKYKHVAS